MSYDPIDIDILFFHFFLLFSWSRIENDGDVPWFDNRGTICIVSSFYLCSGKRKFMSGLAHNIDYVKSDWIYD